jgi:hypothetical protein
MTALILCLLAVQDDHYLYVGRAPKDRDGFRDQKPQLEVHDIDDGHKLVKTIPLPSTVYNIRGICASAAARKLWIAHYGSYNRHDVGKILCLDLVSHKVLWERSYPAAVDRGAVTPDGRKIFMPSGENEPTAYWYVIDGATGQEIDRITHAGYTHNTIVTLDGRRAFLQAFGSRYVAVADTATHEILKRVGPFADTPRPFTINGRGTLLFQCVNDLLGFQVADVGTGKVLYTAKTPSAYPQPGDNGRVVSHGIALRADEKECWIVDQKHCGLHVFDVSGVPGGPPVWKKFIRTRSGSPEIFGQPGWIMSTIDGRYFYPETGEIIDTATKQIVGQLKDPDGTLTHSRFALEIVFRNGVPVRCGDQFGVGRVTAGNLPPAGRLTSPADASTFTAPARITLTASASDPDGSVAKVEFFRGTTLLGVENYAPYTVTWDNVAAGSYRLTARITDEKGAATTTAPVDVTVTPGMSVTSFTLINADTDQPVPGYNPMPAGATLNLRTLPTRRLNLRANTSPPTVGSVRFGYDADADYRVESGAPYALASNDGADYHAWTPSLGSHTVRATPFTGTGATGSAGTARSISFSVVDALAARSAELPDNDLDGIADEEDPDDDDDGVPDEEDADRDGDGASDADELAAGTLVQSKASYPDAAADPGSGDETRCGALGAEALLVLLLARRRRR